MNVRNIAIIASIAAIIISLIAIIFFHALLKEGAPVTAPPSAPAATEAGQGEGYAIPGVSQIEGSVKKAAQQRKESDRVIAEIKAKRAPRREEIRREAEAADKKAIELTKSGAPKIIKPVAVTVVRVPKEEVTRQLKTKGLFAY